MYVIASTHSLQGICVLVWSTENDTIVRPELIMLALNFRLVKASNTMRA